MNEFFAFLRVSVLFLLKVERELKVEEETKVGGYGVHTVCTCKCKAEKTKHRVKTLDPNYE